MNVRQHFSRVAASASALWQAVPNMPFINEELSHRDNTETAIPPIAPVSSASISQPTLNFPLIYEAEQGALRQFFNPTLTTDDDLYYRLQQSIKYAEEQWILQLRTMLDPEVYAATIAPCVENRKERYAITERLHKEAPALFYYQNTINLLRDLYDFLGAALPLHRQILVMSTQGMMGRAWTAYNGLNDQVTRLFEKYWHLYQTFSYFQLDQVIDKFSSIQGILGQCRNALNSLTPLHLLVRHYQHNPFTELWRSEAGQHMVRGQDAFTLKQSLHVLCEFVENRVPPDAVANIHQLRTDSLAMLRLVEEFSTGQHSLFGVIGLVNKLYPKAFRLLRAFPSGNVTLNKVLKTHLLATAWQLNQVFQNIFLLIDRWEWKYNLKEKYLLSYEVTRGISIEKLAEHLHQWTASWGATFRETDCFPYTALILAQRRKYYDAYQRSSVHRAVAKLPARPYQAVHENFMRQRLLASEERVANQERIAREARTAKAAEHYQTVKAQITRLIDRRIGVLEKELLSAWITWSNKKYRKITLLKKLKTEVLFPEENRIHSLAGYEAVRTQLRSNILFTGRTGKMFKEIRYLSAERGDERIVINEQMARLTEKRAGRFWFFAARRKQRLADRILALKALRRWIMKPGCHLEDALDALQTHDIRAYHCLLRYEKTVLEDIKKLEAHFQKDAIGQFVIEPPITSIHDKHRAEHYLQLLEEWQAGLQQRQRDYYADKTSWGFRIGGAIRALNARIKSVQVLMDYLKEHPHDRIDNILGAIEILHPADYRLLVKEKTLIGRLRAPFEPVLRQQLVN